MAIYITINTKGGVGKSTVSQHLITSYLFNKLQREIRFFEVDDQNIDTQKFKNSNVINPKMIKTESLPKFVEESVMFFDEDIVIDVGGNITSCLFLERLKLLGGFLSPTVYLIPLTDGGQDCINSQETHSMIREFDKESPIVYVLNRCSNKNNTELLEREFMDFFGHEILDIKSIKKDKKTSWIALNKNPIYNVIGKIGKTLIEVSIENHDEAYKAAAQIYFQNKDDQNLYKEVRRLMFHKEQATVAKQIFENEYIALFEQLDKLQK